jgi:hypothetical protein
MALFDGQEGCSANVCEPKTPREFLAVRRVSRFKFVKRVRVYHVHDASGPTLLILTVRYWFCGVVRFVQRLPENLS